MQATLKATMRTLGTALWIACLGSACKPVLQDGKAKNVDALTDADTLRKQVCGPEPSKFRALANSYSTLSESQKQDTANLAVKAHTIDDGFADLTDGSDALSDDSIDKIKSILLAVPDLMMYSILERKVHLRLLSEQHVHDQCDRISKDRLQSISSQTLRDHFEKMNKSLQTCWETPKASPRIPVIYMMADTSVDKDLRFPHIALLPAITYAYSGIFMDAMQSIKDGSLQIKGVRVQDLHKSVIMPLKTNLVISLVDNDLKGNDAVLKQYEGIFGKDFRTAPEFRDFVLAEAVDSYYCSTDTNNHFAGRGASGNPFAQTFKDFNDPNGWAFLFGKPWHARMN